MSLWRRLFPKYDCRRCKDTHILESQYAMSRCDCEGSRVEIAKTLKNFSESMKNAEEAQRLRNFTKRIETP